MLTNSEPKVTFISVSDKSTQEVVVKGYGHVNTVDWTASSKSVYVIATAPAERTPWPSGQIATKTVYS